jgi:hypothetical protein
MAKNWNRKLRKITVGDKEYKWLVKGSFENAFDEKVIGIKIFDGDDLLIEDDFMADSVTPGMISDLIEEVNGITARRESTSPSAS